MDILFLAEPVNWYDLQRSIKQSGFEGVVVGSEWSNYHGRDLLAVKNLPLTSVERIKTFVDRAERDYVNRMKGE